MFTDYRKHFVRVMAIVLTVCLVACSLTGCASNGGAADEQTETAQVEVSEKSSKDISEDSEDTAETQQSEEPEEISEAEEEIVIPYTELNMGMPFLTLNEQGFVRDEDALTEDELQTALDILLSDEQKTAWGDSLPEESDTNSSSGNANGKADPSTMGNLVVELLGKISDGEILSDALTKVDLSDGLSRGEFALLIYSISGAAKKQVVFEDFPVIGRDIDLESEKGRALVWASIPLTIVGTDDEADIVDALLSCKWESGKYLLKGYLYEADANGHVLRAETVGDHLVFGDNGRFTSGNAELDDRSAEIVYAQICLNPKYDTYKLLRDCYEEVAWGTYYLHDLPDPEFGDNCSNEWYIDNALHALVDQCGACYSFAAGFCALARNLGYDAHCMAGQLFSTKVPHSWVYIDMPDSEGNERTGENWRIFDPQLYWRGAGQHLVDLYDFNMFYLNPVESHRWAYVWDDPEATCGVWTMEDLK